MDRPSAPLLSNTLHFLKCTLKFCSSQGHRYRSGRRLTSYYPRVLKTDFWVHWSATVVKYMCFFVLFFTPPFIQCDPEKFCLFVPKTFFFYWTFALGNVPEEAITVQQYCDHPCGAAAQRWEEFRLIIQSVECQEGGKSTMDSIPLHCLLDWFANGDAKVRTRDLKGFKTSMSWGFSGVDSWSRLVCGSFDTFFFTEFKTPETRGSRNVIRLTSMGAAISRRDLCHQQNKVDSNFVLFKEPSKIYLKNSVATRLSRNNVLVSLNNPQASHWTAFMLTTFFWEGRKKKMGNSLLRWSQESTCARARARCSYFDFQMVEVMKNSWISHAVFVFVYPVGDAAIFHAALANQIVGLNFICLDHLRKWISPGAWTQKYFVLVHDNQKVIITYFYVILTWFFTFESHPILCELIRVRIKGHYMSIWDTRSNKLKWSLGGKQCLSGCSN